MSLEPQSIIILGSGLAGPCLALLLARQSIQSIIYEVRSQRVEAGGNILLGPHALQVLDKAGVYDAIRKVGYTYNSATAYTEDGERLGEINIGGLKYPALRTLRSNVANVLLDAAEATGLVTIRYGMRCKEIVEDDEEVTACFEDGTKATAPILIGCDGIHTFTRKHVLGSACPTPTFDGTCVVTGFVPTSSAKLPSSDFAFPAFIFTPAGLFMAIPIDFSGSELAWGISKSSPQRTRSEWVQLESSGEAARLVKSGFSSITTEPMRSLLDQADPTECKVWAPYIIPELPTWHSSRCLLIGDAAHGLPPNGLGSALVFEDAAILQLLLTETNHSDYESLFDRFETLRRPRIATFA